MRSKYTIQIRFTGGVLVVVTTAASVSDAIDRVIAEYLTLQAQQGIISRDCLSLEVI